MLNEERHVKDAVKIARKSIGDRLDGTLGADSKHAIQRVLRDAGVSSLDSWALLSAVYWDGWNNGYERGRKRAGGED